MLGSLLGSSGSKAGGAGASDVGAATQQKAGGKKSPWEVSVGPLSFGSKGIDVKPQFKLGLDTDNVRGEFGLSDVRDGVRLGAKAEAKVEAKAEGHSVKELHENIRCETLGFREALATAKRIFEAGGGGVRQIAEKLHIKRDALEALLAGREPDPDQPLMELRVKASVGYGSAGQVNLGWADTQGFKMVGVGGSVAAGFNLGANIFAGKHKSGRSMKICLGIANFDFEYTMPVKPGFFGAKSDTCVEGYTAGEDAPPCAPPDASPVVAQDPPRPQDPLDDLLLDAPPAAAQASSQAPSRAPARPENPLDDLLL